MKQQQLPPLPAGYDQSDVITASGPQATAAPARVPPPMPPQTGPTPKGAGLAETGVSEALSPFSMMGSDNKWKVPDVASGIISMMQRNFGKPGVMDKNPDPAARASEMVHGFVDPVEKMVTGDAKSKAEGFGQMVANAIQVMLGEAMGKAMKGKGVSKGPTPITDEPWQGPLRPTPPPEWQGPPTPPPEWQGPMPESQGPQLPPPEWQGPKPPTAQMMMGPKPLRPTAPQSYGPKNLPEWQGPMPEPQGPQLPGPEWQGPTQPQGPQLPKYVIVRGLNAKNPGQFSRVPTSKIDPDILRTHLNSKIALEADAVTKSKAPKAPPKPKGKK